MLPKTGKKFPACSDGPDDPDDYAGAIGTALRDELGDSHRAAKTLMRWTGASERTVKNWLAGTYGPSGNHLVAVIRHSDAAFAAVMLMSGRERVLAAKKLIGARDTLVAMLEIIADLTA
jgi:hypothetical protein